MKKEENEQVEDIKNFARFKNNNRNEFASSKHHQDTFARSK